MSTGWKHDDLMLDLAGHVKGPDRMVWCDMQLGAMHSPRPDVYAINKSYSNPRPTAYECKISREDFRSDVTAGKWQVYLQYADCVIFAAPAGLISKSEVPQVCGLIQRHENAWRLAKKPTLNPCEIPQEAWLKLLIDGIQREGAAARRKQYPDAEIAFAKKFGREAAAYVHDAAFTQAKIEHAEYEASRIMDQAKHWAERHRKDCDEALPEKWRELLEVLELDSGADKYRVAGAIRALKNKVDGGEDKMALKAIMQSLRITMNKYEHLTAKEPI